MIQRIQTVWLFLIAVLSGLSLFLPATERVNPEVASSFPFEMLFTIGNGIFFLFSVIIIFLYNNRPLQIKLSYGLLILLILFSAMTVCYFWVSPAGSIIYKYPIVFHTIAIIFDLLAIHSIKKDEKLVRSLDRLR